MEIGFWDVLGAAGIVALVASILGWAVVYLYRMWRWYQ